MTEHRLDPRVRLVWATSGLLVALVVGVGSVVLAVALEAPSWLLGLLVLLTVALLVIGVVSPVLSYRAWQYRVDPDGLELRHGVLVRRISLIPYHRIQQIDVRRGVVERGLGLSTLVLRTAAATSDATIPGLAEDVAAPLRMDLLARAGVSDAV